MRPTLFLLLTTLLLLCAEGCREDLGPEALTRRTCSSCHTYVPPEALPKSVWSERILPEMAARMGIATFRYDPSQQLPPGEYDLARAHGFYPEAPTLRAGDWETVKKFILSNAPDTLAAPPALELDSLRQFTARTLSLDDRAGSLVSFIGKGTEGMVVGDGYGQLWNVSPEGEAKSILSLTLPLVHFTGGADSLLLEIGNIYPTEASNGKLYRVRNGTPTVLQDSLHRPVYHLAEDLDADGREEIVVCEYGNFSGAVSLLDPKPDGTYSYRRLLGTAGATRLVGADLDRDGRRDLVVLHAQGDEGIDVLTQRDDGSFDRTVLVRFPAVWGTSWFELVDMDGDGDLDLVTVHGDNADYSNVVKPYHGVRIYTNDGENHFTETFFQALPGATRVVARDFDRDGDVDLAVAANFADWRRQPESSFVYMEQRGTGAAPDFRTYGTPLALEGRWLIMEAGDYDGDGDEDLALGSFTLNPASVPNDLAVRWRESRTDLLLLDNTLR